MTVATSHSMNQQQRKLKAARELRLKKLGQFKADEIVRQRLEHQERQRAMGVTDPVLLGFWGATTRGVKA